jgi:hypothetical protein
MSQRLSKQYIPALEGMRSLAVLAVLLFHLDIHFFYGGFLGVDLFFIISGFIITRNLLFDIERQRFSLKAFYYRRIRRIIPALVTTIFFTLFAALAIMPSAELVLTAISASQLGNADTKCIVVQKTCNRNAACIKPEVPRAIGQSVYIVVVIAALFYIAQQIAIYILPLEE